MSLLRPSSLDVHGDGFGKFLPERSVLGVGELEREGVRPGLELHRALLLRLTEVQVGGVEGNLDSLLDVSPLLVHDDVVAGPSCRPSLRAPAHVR